MAHTPTFTVPGSSTNTALVRWNGTGGNNIQDSTILVGATTMGLAADTDLLTFGNATLAITGAVTGVTALTVDNLNINGNTLTANSGAVNITPAAGSAIVLDGAVNVDAGVVTGATSITSTQFVGGGVGLTALNGTQITSGTVPVAQLGSSGSRSSSTFLNGANAWAAAGGGAMTLISSTNVTSNTTNIDFTGLSGYETYFLQISGAVPSTDGPYVVMQIGDSSGFDTAQNEYGWHMLQIRSNLGSVENTAKPHTENDTNSTWISLYRRGLGNATNEGYSGSFWISNKANQFTRIYGTFCATSYLNETQGGLIVGERRAAITMDRIRFKMHVGSVASGRISVYGVSHA